MKVFLFSVLAVIGIAFAASVVLETYQSTADRTFVGKGARPDPEPRLR